MKSVAIIGAGPGGLVAAKTLLHHASGLFNVTIFEKASQLGGLWNLRKGSKDLNGFLSPDTPTNLSKFTVCFSDLAWDSVSLGHTDGNDRHRRIDSTVPMFPRAWMVGTYLDQYAEKFGLKRFIRFEHEVVGAQRLQEEGVTKWRLQVKSSEVIDGANPQQGDRVKDFDDLIVASGFFSKPRPPSSSLSPSTLPPNIRAIHSSEYRTLNNVLPPGSVTSTRNTLLIIGGGNSAGEAAGTIAHHISSAIHSPDTRRQDLKDVKIVHVLPRPIYALPPYVVPAPGKTGFLPVDLRLYDFTARQGRIDSYGGKQPAEAVPMVHGFLRSILGGDQSDLGAPALVADLEDSDGPGAAYAALSECYPEFVRQGLIVPVAGRVTSLQVGDGDDGEQALIAEYTSGDAHKKIDGIAAIVHASGYTPSGALEWLPPDVLGALEYNPKAMRIPIILDMLQTVNTAVPELAFIGFYEGPYWGVMEMQARLVAELWASTAQGRAPGFKARAFESKDSIRNLRRDIESKDRRVGQYWFNDYLGYMEEAATDLGMERLSGRFAEGTGPTTPARYSYSSVRPDEDAVKAMSSLWQTMEASQNGAFVPRAVFRALQGHWKLHRRIDSVGGGLPSGTFVGDAWLHAREPTPEGRSGQERKRFDYEGEYLYIEQGTFSFDSGGQAQASRRYVYRYDELDDVLSVWFVKPSEQLVVDYLYHNLAFQKLEVVDEEEGRQRMVANADHLCVDDMYRAKYEFEMMGVRMARWKCTHTVKGPAKDYITETIYER